MCFNSWYVLEIESNVKFNDSMQAFAAGYLEANLTSGKDRVQTNLLKRIETSEIKIDLIALNILNVIGTSCDDPKDKQCIELKAWLDKNFEWMGAQIKGNPLVPYWHHVRIQSKSKANLSVQSKIHSTKVGLVLDQFTGLAQGYYGNDTFVSLNSWDFLRHILSNPKYFKLL